MPRQLGFAGTARDNQLPIALLAGAALGWFACRYLSARGRIRPRTSLDYAVAGRAGVYDPSDESSYSSFGALDAEESRLQRLRQRVVAFGEYRDRLLLRARASLGRSSTPRGS